MAEYDDGNVFAKILRGEIPCDRVLETEHALAFRDVNPQRPVHVLVIPKGKYVTMGDFAANASAEERSDLVEAVGKVIEELGLEEGGYRLIANSGRDGRQEVPHLHWHVVAGADAGPMMVAMKPSSTE